MKKSVNDRKFLAKYFPGNIQVIAREIEKH